jgi:signal transduction histidine kinase
MLEFTDIQQATQQKANEWVSINQLCRDTYRLMQFRADEKGIKLVYEGLSQDYEVKLVAEHIRRAISNLLSNAIKFSEGGKEVFFKVERNEKGILISIQDFGIGIPQAYSANIFDSFTATRRRGTNGEAAFGLGLSIVKSIVEAHQGSVWYISAEGMGATFFIQLPASRLKN